MAEKIQMVTRPSKTDVRGSVMWDVTFVLYNPAVSPLKHTRWITVRCKTEDDALTVINLVNEAGVRE